MNATIEKKRVSDNPLIAFLIAKGFSFKPINENQKIEFLMYGEGLQKAIDDFYSNMEIPVQSYLAAFKTVKGIVLSMKDSNE